MERDVWIASGVDADIAHKTKVRLADGGIEQYDRKELVALGVQLATRERILGFARLMMGTKHVHGAKNARPIDGIIGIAGRTIDGSGSFVADTMPAVSQRIKMTANAQ